VATTTTATEIKFVLNRVNLQQFHLLLGTHIIFPQTVGIKEAFLDFSSGDGSTTTRLQSHHFSGCSGSNGKHLHRLPWFYDYVFAPENKGFLLSKLGDGGQLLHTIILGGAAPQPEVWAEVANVTPSELKYLEQSPKYNALPEMIIESFFVHQMNHVVVSAIADADGKIKTSIRRDFQDGIVHTIAWTTTATTTKSTSGKTSEQPPIKISIYAVALPNAIPLIQNCPDVLLMMAPGDDGGGPLWKCWNVSIDQSISPPPGIATPPSSSVPSSSVPTDTFLIEINGATPGDEYNFTLITLRFLVFTSPHHSRSSAAVTCAFV
jgi:hypothetical protein